VSGLIKLGPVQTVVMGRPDGQLLNQNFKIFTKIFPV